MARRRFAPTHDLCARMRYIPESDTAWDMDRIQRELAELGPDGENGDTGHPFFRYHSGTTRYDLDADGMRDYLRPDVVPEMWLFRRLEWAQREQIAHMQRAGQTLGAARVAFLGGVVGIENASNEAGRELDRLLRMPLPRSSERCVEILAAVEAYAAEVILEVGTACLLASRDLSPEEKKLCATQRGASSPSG